MKKQNKWIYYWVIEYNCGYGWEPIEWYDKRDYSYGDVKHDYREYRLVGNGSYRIVNKREYNKEYVKIFDNKETKDRYTAIYFGKKNYLQMIAFDSDPFHPLGFGQHCGEWHGGNDFSCLGKEISINDLSNNAKKFVVDNM